MIFVTSDLHFNHNREFLFKPRGFNCVEVMNETIITNHNSVVGADDDVYILGDLCLGGGGDEVLQKNKELIELLNGKLHIVLGNHDTAPRIAMYKTCKNVVSVSYAEFLRYNGYHFFMTHYPCLTANLEAESLKQCTISLFGHTHQQNNFHNDIPFMYHVGQDSHNCFPVSLDDAIQDMKNKVKECFEQIQELSKDCKNCISEFTCADRYFNKRCNNYKKDPPDGGYY